MHWPERRRRRRRRRGRGRELIALLAFVLAPVAGCGSCVKEEEPVPDLPAKSIRVDHLKKDLWVVDGGLRETRDAHAEDARAEKDGH